MTTNAFEAMLEIARRQARETEITWTCVEIGFDPNDPLDRKCVEVNLLDA